MPRSRLPADENCKQLVEVSFLRLDEHALVATYGDGDITWGVGRTLLGHPLYWSQLRKSASQRVEHHRHGSAKLSGHRRHLGGHVHVRLVGNQLPISRKLTSRHDAVNLDKVIQCSHLSFLLSSGGLRKDDVRPPMCTSPNAGLSPAFSLSEAKGERLSSAARGFLRVRWNDLLGVFG